MRATAARRVEDYRRDNGLIGVQNVLVVEQQLRNLNEQLSVSRGRENEALATLNQAQAAGAFGVADTGTGDALQSQVMTELQTDSPQSRQPKRSSRLLCCPTIPA